MNLLRKLLGIKPNMDTVLTAGEMLSLHRKWAKDTEGLRGVVRPVVVLLLTSEMVFSSVMEGATDWYVVPETYRDTLNIATLAAIAGYFGLRTIEKIRGDKSKN